MAVSPFAHRRKGREPLWFRFDELALGSGAAAEEAFRAEVFVDVGPVNAVATARRFPMVLLL